MDTAHKPELVAPYCASCDSGHDVPCTCTHYKAPFVAKVAEAQNAEACKRCKSGGQSVVRIEGLCELCFCRTYIDPINKEIQNTEEVLNRLRDAKYVQTQRLGIARKVQIGILPRNTYKCHKGCGFQATFGALYELMWHEENCKFTKPNATKKRADAGQRKIKVVVSADADDEKVVI